MILLFNHAPEIAKTLPGNRIDGFLQQCNQNRFTGLIHIGRPPEICIILTFSQGTLVQQGILQGDSWRDITPSQIQQYINLKNNIINSLALPTEALRIVRALLEWYPPQITLLGTTNDLPQLLAGWEQEPLRSIVRITWSEAEGFVLLSGKSHPPLILYTTPTQIKIGPEALTENIYHYPDLPCSIARYLGPQETTNPQDDLIALQNAFMTLLNHLTQRYARLVGMGLAQTLFDELNQWAAQNHWSIELTQAGIKDETGFPDLETAAQAYHVLLGEAIRNLEDIIGPRMTRSLIQDAAQSLPQPAQQLLRRLQIVDIH